MRGIEAAFWGTLRADPVPMVREVRTSQSAFQNMAEAEKRYKAMPPRDNPRKAVKISTWRI